MAGSLWSCLPTSPRIITLPYERTGVRAIRAQVSSFMFPTKLGVGEMTKTGGLLLAGSTIALDSGVWEIREALHWP